MSYDCDLKITGYSNAETRIENGETYSYPSMFDIKIENWTTYKGSFRLSDGRFIGEGCDLNGPGLTVAQLYRRQLRQLKAHAELIKNIDHANETNSIFFKGTFVVVENADAKEWFHHETIFVIICEDGRETRWYGNRAEDALWNAAPFLGDLKPAMIRVETKAVSNE